MTLTISTYILVAWNQSHGHTYLQGRLANVIFILGDELKRSTKEEENEY